MKTRVRYIRKVRNLSQEKLVTPVKNFRPCWDVSKKIVNRIKIGQLNINSIRNKFDLLAPAVVRNLDNLLITAQFEIDGFTTPWRVDRDCHGGGILLCIKQDIPSKLLINLKISENLEGVFVDPNFRRKKWLVFCSYNPQKLNITKHLDVIGKNLDLYSSRCENYLLLGLNYLNLLKML